MTKTLLAVDGNSLIHRSFHALFGTNLRTGDGRATWAVKGALSQILGAVQRSNADAIVIGFDDAGNNSRKIAHPTYKANRSEKPADLTDQLALAVDVFRDAGLHVVVPQGLEADDVLASAAATATTAGWHTVVCTSDRDSFALINDTTSVLRIINGGVEASPVLTPERLRILVGIDPQQYRQYAAMRGDTSDNLVGIHGIGEKTAVRILNVFGSVEAAFADVDTNAGQRVAAEVGKAVVKKLADPAGREAFWRNVEIMTMRTDIDLGIDLDAPFGEALLPLDAGDLAGALAGVEMHSLQGLARQMLTWSPDQPTPAHSGVTVTIPSAAAAVLEAAAADVEQDALTLF